MQVGSRNLETLPVCKNCFFDDTTYKGHPYLFGSQISIQHANWCSHPKRNLGPKNRKKRQLILKRKNFKKLGRLPTAWYNNIENVLSAREFYIHELVSSTQQTSSIIIQTSQLRKQKLTEIIWLAQVTWLLNTEPGFTGSVLRLLNSLLFRPDSALELRKKLRGKHSPTLQFPSSVEWECIWVPRHYAVFMKHSGHPNGHSLQRLSVTIILTS